ncbi:MAG: CopD family protein [Gemmatimonadaceae bacterium]
MVTNYLLLQAAEDSVTASGLALEYAGFLAYFGIFGALGFRWLVLMRTNAARSATAGATAASLGLAEIGAARIGVIGTLFLFLNLYLEISAKAAEKAVSFSAAWSAGGNENIIEVGFAVVFLISFAAAIKRVRGAWVLAAIIGVIFVFQDITSGKWTSLVNPLHETAASLWIGTLFVMVVAGLPAVLRSDLPSEDRGSLVADMVGTFSPVAIGAALLLVATGITTAWRHLKYVSALWTTPYGDTLDIKLVFVATVVALGAWNWRRMRPQLGSEEAGRTIHRSAMRELFFAAIVIVITGVLVSLPTPRLPHP